MFLYAESPERERNTLSHLTEAFWPCFPQPHGRICTRKTILGVMEKRAGGEKRKKLLAREKRGEQKGGLVTWAGG